MRHDWAEHILQAREEIKTGARTGAQADIERELRLEAEVQDLLTDFVRHT